MGNVGLGMLVSAETGKLEEELLEVRGRVQFCFKTSDSQWACSTVQGMELAGGQLRSPDRTQTFRSILIVVFSGTQRGTRIDGKVWRF